jgi:hypothetical protein
MSHNLQFRIGSHPTAPAFRAPGEPWGKPDIRKRTLPSPNPKS